MDAKFEYEDMVAWHPKIMAWWKPSLRSHGKMDDSDILEGSNIEQV